MLYKKKLQLSNINFYIFEISKKTTDDGKYFEVIIDRFEVVMEDTLFVEFQLKVRKINKIRKIVGYIVVNQSLGNEIKVEAKSLKKQGKKNFYK